MTVEELQRHSGRKLDPEDPLPVVTPGSTFETISEQISSIVLTRKTPPFWWAMFGFGVSLLVLFAISVTYLVGKGVGIWGVNIPVAWGFAITNFVWWIGIGHAGTLISAILLLLNQPWRNSINRFAEAMTLFAVACAGLFPLLHLGRPWLFYWLLPYPNTMTVQPQFRSPLVWDVFAVSTYAAVSLLFWYLGMIPDLATLRDRSTGFKYGLYGVLSRLDGAAPPVTGNISKVRLCCWPAWPLRLSCRSTPSSASISPSRSCRAGTPLYFRLTSSPALFTRASPWFSCFVFRCALSTD